MGYNFKPDEPAGKGIVRMLRELAAGAAEDLSHADRAYGVHEARKRFKKARALLRLVRPRLGERFAAENGRLRDAAHQLAGMREADALIECFDKLAAAEQFGDRHAAVRARLEARRGEVGDAAELESHAGRVKAAVVTWGDELGHWQLGRIEGAEVVQGLAASFSGGRRAWRNAMADPSAENFHEWRKRVKEHGYQLRLFEACWPPLIEATEEVLDRLAELLGDDHDLAMLDALLAAEPDRFGADEASAMQTAVAQRQAALRSAADRIAMRYYAERPRQLRRRFEAYWVAWLTESKQPPRRQPQPATDQPKARAGAASKRGARSQGA